MEVYNYNFIYLSPSINEPTPTVQILHSLANFQFADFDPLTKRSTTTTNKAIPNMS